jgi:hypothetical protein
MLPAGLLTAQVSGFNSQTTAFWPTAWALRMALCIVTCTTTRVHSPLSTTRRLHSHYTLWFGVLSFKYSFLLFFIPEVMTTRRPSHVIHPSAKLTADNVGELELSWHCHVVASATSVTPRQLATSSASFLPPCLPQPTPSDSDNTQSPLTSNQPRTSCKRPRVSHAGIDTSPSSPSLIDDHDDTLISKKAKKNGPPTDLDASGMHSDVQIMDISDVDDPRDESLNKMDPTADIKAFFTALPRVPGQPKPCMSCNLCR